MQPSGISTQGDSPALLPEEARLGLAAGASLAEVLAADPSQYGSSCKGLNSFYMSLSLAQIARLRQYRAATLRGEHVFSHCTFPDEQM